MKKIYFGLLILPMTISAKAHKQVLRRKKTKQALRLAVDNLNHKGNWEKR